MRACSDFSAISMREISAACNPGANPAANPSSEKTMVMNKTLGFNGRLLNDMVECLTDREKLH